MSAPAISATSIEKRFGETVALAGVTFEVEAGTIYGLLGPNGAGKTTAIRVLSTILAPDAGRAEIMGHDVAKDPDSVRRIIGLAGQYAAVDPNLTGTENLQMVGKLTQLRRRDIGGRATDLLARFDLTEAADRPVRTYSGGMRRRLDVAAALVAKPPVLFLDEPTTGLDVTTRRELWGMLRELVSEGTTVLLTTQYLEEADHLASRIAVVDTGKVIAEDTPSALKARLGDTVIELGMGDDATSERALALLTDLPDTKGEREGATVRLTSSAGTHALIEGLRRLDEAKMEPVTLDVREPSLDDVFLNLTGHHAESTPDDVPATNLPRRGAKR